MEITKNELKKVFTLKNIIILFIISVLFYRLYIITPSLSNLEDLNKIVATMVKDYGTSMDEEEYKDFKSKYNDKVKLANEFIKNNKEFSDLDIKDYREFDNIVRNDGEEKYNNEKLHDLYYKYAEKENNKLLYELQEIENIILCYEYERSIDKEPYFDVVSNQNKYSKEKAIVREKELLNNDSRNSLLPYTIFENYDYLIKRLTTLVIISIVFVMSTIYLKDKLENINYIQYSSKSGRSIFKKKIVVTILSTILITSVQLIVFFIYYKTKNNSIFLDCNISGFFNTPIKSWYDLSFRNYIGITIVFVYLIGISIGLISMYISSKVSSYISLIGIQVINIFIVNNFLLQILINKVSSMYIVISKIGYVYLPKYFMPTIYTVLIILPLIILYFRNKKELKYNI